MITYNLNKLLKFNAKEVAKNIKIWLVNNCTEFYFTI